MQPSPPYKDKNTTDVSDHIYYYTDVRGNGKKISTIINYSPFLLDQKDREGSRHWHSGVNSQQKLS